NVSFPSLPAVGFGAMVEKNRKRAKTMLLQSSVRSGGGNEVPRISKHKRTGSDMAPVPPPPVNRPQQLRRTSSMGSLTQLRTSQNLTRVTSTTSTIGDDSQFLHIHTRPNVRFKAIKENFKAGLPNVSMPQLPQAFANFRF